MGPTFVDLCGGPGGFSEYVLWRTRNAAAGWGISLDTDDSLRWSLRGNVRSAVERGHFRLLRGADGTGDLTRPENIAHFAETVLRATRGRGVDLALADGAFSVEGRENAQEPLTWRLILCELLAGLMVLPPGGSLMCKLFDCFEPRTVDLIYAVGVHFERVALVKPVSSRPANSERYLVCKSLRSSPAEIVRWLASWNRELEAGAPPPWRLLDEDLWTTDRAFAEFIYTCNNQVAERQIRELGRIEEALSNPSQTPQRSPSTASLRSECFRSWNLPMSNRPATPSRRQPQRSRPSNRSGNRGRSRYESVRSRSLRRQHRR